MSLEPHWFSTIYGLQSIVGQVLAALALTVLVLMLLSRYEPLSNRLGPSQFHDFGNLLLAFVLLWAYLAFSQYLITWSGNLPEEIPWYLNRTRGGWQWVGLLLVVFHFAVPFFLLLLRTTKRKARALARVAAALLALQAGGFDLDGGAGVRSGRPSRPLDGYRGAGGGRRYLAGDLLQTTEGDASDSFT